MEIAGIFNNNRTQAVRLPKAVAFPMGVKRVCIAKLGRSRLITPEEDSWEAFFASSPVSDDYVIDREQPQPQGREEF
jgi:antitoxin VapB